mmetsp:Transcript_11138/g.39419  ORF Transcript_11138/g.39419 Transcript_11138/m.39419 type:complete len:284 (+) Transcript_11138:3-854(+)
MRRDSWRSVPSTKRPPSWRTWARSASTTAAYSALTASNAAPTSSLAVRGASAPLKTAEKDRAADMAAAEAMSSSTASNTARAVGLAISVETSKPWPSLKARSPGSSRPNSRRSSFAAARQAASRSASTSGDSSGLGSSSTETRDCAARSASTRGTSDWRTRRRATSSALPPSRMSVPRPAMLVAMVTALTRPACEMISDSRSATSGLAFRTRCLMPSLESSSLTSAESSMEVVPTSTGRPASCSSWTRARTLRNLASFVAKTRSGSSRRKSLRKVGTRRTSRP